MARLCLLAAVVCLVAGGPLPTCESDTEQHCLGEGVDMSSEGVEACLLALGEAGRSDLCNQYRTLLAGCKKDTERGGVCEEEARNGEAVPCLVQRTAPAQLSAGCQAALPLKAEAKGLGLYWARGSGCSGAKPAAAAGWSAQAASAAARADPVCVSTLAMSGTASKQHSHARPASSAIPGPLHRPTASASWARARWRSSSATSSTRTSAGSRRRRRAGLWWPVACAGQWPVMASGLVTGPRV